MDFNQKRWMSPFLPNRRMPSPQEKDDGSPAQIESRLRTGQGLMANPVHATTLHAGRNDGMECAEGGRILLTANGLSHAISAIEEKAVDYPRDLRAIKASMADDIAANWPLRVADGLAPRQ